MKYAFAKKSGALLSLLLVGQTTLAASGDSGMLQSGDFVGYSFWLISMALAASTIFFLMESLRMG